ncbi:MAG: branched-chain amino acid ABC transporter permease [Alphaproteobacteria bacterium]|jgi:branched-chain amino acid transport system permease protein|nr:branched-chain amino acid ABC transporter permease [Alphaproteobacteria bacterium]
MYEILILNGLVNGIIVGVLYSLIGCSLNVLYGVLRVVNFAHGEFLIVGSFFGYVLFREIGVHPLLSVPLAAMVFFVVGYLLYYLLLPRLAQADDPETSSFLMMYGVSLMLGAAMLMIFEADTRALDFRFKPMSINLGMVYVPTARLVALAVNVMVAVLLTWFLYATLYGKAMRATIMNREAIQIVGVNIHRLSAVAFGVAAGLAGITGVMIALVFPAFNPFSGPEYTLIGFIVIVLGGLGHPIGAIVGGIIFGLTEQMSIVFMPQAMSPIVGFSILILVIFLRPRGLFGKLESR